MTDTLRIVADENMPGLASFSEFGELVTLPGRQIRQADLQQAEVLLVRSVTRVDAALLAGTPVRFVGSATIGTDHIDLPALQHSGIRFAHAPGCNAIAVAEYVLQAALAWAVANRRRIGDMRVAVIGLGQVGSRVANLFAALGAQICPVDPPRAAAADRAWPWQSLSEVLDADLITLHVPLTDAAEHSTRHMIDASILARLTPTQLLINTSRGAVIDNHALLDADPHRLPALVLDVWEQEPLVPRALFQRVRLGTPHIAGYSVQGKWRGTLMLHQALQQFLGVQLPLPTLPISELLLPWSLQDEAALLALLRYRYPQQADHQALQAQLDQGAEAFDRLRKHYPARHELSGITLTGALAAPLRPLAALLGVQVTQRA